MSMFSNLSSKIKPDGALDNGLMVAQVFGAIAVGAVAFGVAPGTFLGATVGMAGGSLFGTSSDDTRKNFRRVMTSLLVGASLGAVVDKKTESFGLMFQPVPTVSVTCDKPQPDTVIKANNHRGLVRLHCDR